jgi:hypothetical protein
MSSRFVSAGAIDAASGEAVPVQVLDSAGTASSRQDSSDGKDGGRRGEWAAVQAQLDTERKQREEERRRAANAHGAGSGERSLYEVLQANKAAKQAAFEEKNKIKNQFRALDDDEIDFLDGVKSGERQREERIRKEMEEGLEAFRAKQRSRGTDNPDREQVVEGEEGEDGDEADSWAVATGRKRKRQKDNETRGSIKGLKRQLSDTTRSASETQKTESPAKDKAPSTQPKPSPRSATTEKPAETRAKPKLSLVNYGSDDENNDDE